RVPLPHLSDEYRFRIGAALAVCIPLFMLLWGGTFHGPMRSPVALAQHVVLIGMCFFAARRLGSLGGFARKGDRRLIIAGTALLAYVELRAITAAYPRFSGTAALAVIAGVGLVVVTLSYARGSAEIRRHVLTGVALLGAIVAAIALVQWSRELTPRASAPFGHHNLLGAFLALVLPVQAALTLSSAHDRSERSIGAVAAGLGLVALLATRSLGSVIGVLVAIPAVPLANLLLRPAGSDRPRRPAGVLAGAAIAALVAVAVVPTTEAGQALSTRMARLASGGGDRSGSERIEFFKAASAGVREVHPWIGFGTGMTPFAFPLDLRQRVVRQAEGVAVTHLHSTPVQVAYELGLVGLVLATLTGGLATASVARRLRVTEPGTDRTVLLAALGAGVAYGVRCLTDVNFLALAVPYTGCGLLGLALAVPSDGESGAGANGDEAVAERLPGQGFLYALLDVPALLLIPLLVRADLAHRRADAGFAATEQITQASLVEALDHYKAAHRWDPKFGFYAFEAGVLTEALSELERRPERLDEADRLLAEAMLATPTVPGYALHLGWLRLRRGQLEDAIGPISLAATVENRSAFAQPVLGRLLLERGDMANAVEVFTEMHRQRPICVCAEMFHQPPLAEKMPAILDEVGRRDEMAGRAARALFESCRDESRIVDRQTLHRTDDQNPWKARSLYVFRRPGVTTLTAPFVLRVTESSRRLNRTRASMKLHAEIDRRSGPARARPLLDSRFRAARPLLPPEFL
ncbi:MAG: hypothetical protein CME06_02590, partial [Gemmatimonadetes bacterium]|nr:hypothetical protein [Gemmatimonadota bacterium]